MDVIEDIRGSAVVALVATSNAINNTTMRFDTPVKVTGDDGINTSSICRRLVGPGLRRRHVCVQLLDKVQQRDTALRLMLELQFGK